MTFSIPERSKEKGDGEGTEGGQRGEREKEEKKKKNNRKKRKERLSRCSLQHKATARITHYINQHKKN